MEAETPYICELGEDAERLLFSNTNDFNLDVVSTVRETLTLLQIIFFGRVISLRSEIDWPPRSSDLTPLDFYLWGYLEEVVYVDK